MVDFVARACAMDGNKRYPLGFLLSSQTSSTITVLDKKYQAKTERYHNLQ